MGSSWARWRNSRSCWETSGRPCPRWGWSSTCGQRRSGARPWCQRRLPSQPRHAFTCRRARRCWGYRSTGLGAPTGNTDFHAAQGPHRGLLHVRPGAHLPAAGPGTGADMGDPGSSSHIPPHRPRSPRTSRQGDEVHIEPAVPAQLPGARCAPVGRTDRPHTTAGCNGMPPDARRQQGRGIGDGCRLAPSLGPDSSGRPGPPRRRGAGACPPLPDVRWGL